MLLFAGPCSPISCHRVFLIDLVAMHTTSPFAFNRFQHGFHVNSCSGLRSLTSVADHDAAALLNCLPRAVQRCCNVGDASSLRENSDNATRVYPLHSASCE